jgi:ribonuclease G
VDKELIVKKSAGKVEMALLENGKLMVVQTQTTEETLLVGDIFLGSIKKMMPSLNAAFVDIGVRKDAFLHYTDLGPQLRSLARFTDMSRTGKNRNALLGNFKLQPDIIKSGKIDQVLTKKQLVLVQITKEPISTKGPRLTSELTIPGRYVVLSPFNQHVAVSKKIPDAEERKRLKLLIESIRPKNFGVIVRTAAAGKMVADLHEEIRQLTDTWRSIHKQLKSADKPQKLISEIDKTSSFIRDVLNEDFTKIVVNDTSMYQNIKSLMKQIAPEKAKIVSNYSNQKPIFDTFGINRQIKSSFGKTSTMNSGAYLVIEHTEAMTVIDVNSGPKMQRSDQESAALAVNLESAKEISRQLRLRDIGGLIIIDFIDMRKQENKATLYKEMKKFMNDDRAQHTILPLSKFGLMQITRQRTKPVVKIDTSEQCPSCKGTGVAQATILITDTIENDLERIMASNPKSKVNLEVHPFVYSYFTKGLFGKRFEWFKKYYTWIKIKENTIFHLDEYKFYDKNGDEIRITVN